MVQNAFVRIPFIFHNVLLKIAQDQLQKAERFISKNKKPSINKDFYAAANYLDRLQEFTMVSVVFSAAAVEGLINHYGKKKLGETVFSQLSRLKVVEKVSLFPLLTVQKSFNKTTLGSVKGLMKLRNGIVHSEPFTVRFFDTRESHWITIGQARESVKTARTVFEEIQSLNPRYFIDDDVNMYR